jgi:hypothetical protein
MGYALTVELTGDSLDIELPDIFETPLTVRVQPSMFGSKEYFLLENRQQKGYDTALPGNGLLIYHVDENVTTQNDNEYYSGHTTEGHYLVALEQADGKSNLDKGADSGDLYDAFFNRTFNERTLPRSRGYDSGVPTYVVIDSISASQDTMSFDVRLDAPPPITGLTAELDTTGGEVTLSWDSYTPLYNDEITTYVVYSNGAYYSSTTDTFDVSALPKDVNHSFQVAALLTHHESPWSDPVELYLSDAPEIVSTTPDRFELSQAYPNPFNPTARLRLSMPMAGHVTAEVFDVLGRRVTTLMNGTLRAGTTELEVNGEHWPSGLYFVRVNTSGGESAVQKIVLMR